ncbi:MAG: aldolase/citrate lyase family protein [Ilumatobacteraceae bacterium]|nr:aldolase/citrate lyase family protein [Ilumatobacteraceae bacterium]
MNPLMDRLASGGVACGTFVMYVRTPGFVRLAKAAGLDFVVVDLQHSGFGFETVADMCEVGRAAGISVLVRPNDVSQDSINRILDAGADGIVLHDVCSAEQLRRSISMTRYPPHGGRGIALGGPGADYRAEPIDTEFLEQCNERVVVVAQIESAIGLEHLDEILDVEGITAVEVGKQDLSISLGVPGERSHPRVVDAARRVVDACAARDIVVFLSASSREQIGDCVASGARMITWRTDKAILLGEYRSFVSDLADFID